MQDHETRKRLRAIRDELTSIRFAVWVVAVYAISEIMAIVFPAIAQGLFHLVNFVVPL